MQKARKINKTETLISHANVLKLPPVNSKTYDQVIKESVKNIHKIEGNMKQYVYSLHSFFVEDYINDRCID